MIVPLIASLIFVGMLGLVFSEKLNCTLTAILSSALMKLAGRMLGFYSESQAIAAVDLNTLGLLLGSVTTIVY